MTRAALFSLACLLFLGVLMPACKAKTDLGQVCKMTRPRSDKNTDQDIPEGKVGNKNIDYLALGSAECDDLACIRTSRSENPDNKDGKAFGYCTSPCIDDSNCSPDFNGAENTMKCERMLLDEAFLQTLKETDPATFEATFGTSASARFCVLPRKAP